MFIGNKDYDNGARKGFFGGLALSLIVWAIWFVFSHPQYFIDNEVKNPKSQTTDCASVTKKLLIDVAPEKTSEADTTPSPTSAIAEAIRRREMASKIDNSLQEFGIDKMWNRLETEQLVFRVWNNSDLGDALKKTKRNSLMVVPSSEFKIGPAGWILWIDINATDDEIIEFLLGKERKP